MSAAILSLAQARRTQRDIDLAFGATLPAPDAYEIEFDDLTERERTDFGLLDEACTAGTTICTEWADTQPSEHIHLLDEPAPYAGPRLAALRREGGLADAIIIALAAATMTTGWLLRALGVWGAI
jgi:hypothetical protein